MLKNDPPFLKLFAIACLVTPFFIESINCVAQTGGPSSPEVESFTPVGVSEMVDPATGSFTYSIPLIEVDGYPINLSYQSGATMDQQASMVGLGWNLNIGVIKRTVRGLPDDFHGEYDAVTKEFNMKPNKTYGGSYGVSLELFGKKQKVGKLGLQASLGTYYNNYDGIGIEFSVTPSLAIAVRGSGALNASMGLGVDSNSGLSATPKMSFDYNMKIAGLIDVDLGLNANASFNSRKGMAALTMGPTLGVSPRNVFKNNVLNNLLKLGSVQFGTSISYSKPSYTPSYNLPMVNTSFSYSLSGGVAFYGAAVGSNTRGYFTKQHLRKKSETLPAYGILYAHEGQDKAKVLMDFNYEKDGTFDKKTQNLAIPVMTNDIYAVSGQGVGGTYHLKRGDTGIFFDPKVENFSSGSNLGVEVGSGNLFHGGADFHFVATTSESGKWREDNEAYENLKFQLPKEGKPEFETAYFKMAGERSVETDPAFFQNQGGFEPVRVRLESGRKRDLKVKAEPILENEYGGSVHSLNQPLKRNARERRNQSISFLTGSEAENFGFNKTLFSFPLGEFMDAEEPRKIYRSANESHFANHISEITVLRDDGTKYVYGQTAYNIKQKEVTFSVNKIGDNRTGLVEYQPFVENTKSNPSGRDNYFSSDEMGHYAYAYHLSAVLSPDYVDVDGDGVSDNDLGQATKFNYSMLQSYYGWRTPMEVNEANYNTGYRTDPYDGKGSYLYGRKEIHVIHSIEGRTQIAEIYYSPREDGYGTDGENGGIIAEPILQKLDSIVLYSKPDREINKQDAIPIKTVHFEYDYWLCPEIPNNPNPDGGKLTLVKLWFTEGDSKKGSRSPYNFEYANNDEDLNPKYNIKGYNRWGSFQDNEDAPADANDISNSTLSTHEYPYVPQDDRNTADDNGHAWQMTGIDLPSGGKISVEYEANDYAFVQDRRAMELFPIKFTSVDNTDLNQDNPFFFQGGQSYNYLYFHLSEPMPAGITEEQGKHQLKKDYLGDLVGSLKKPMYFKAMIDISAGRGLYEDVSGFAWIENYGVAKSDLTLSHYDLGFVMLKEVCLKKDKSGCDKINPIAKTAMNFTCRNRPEIAHGATSLDNVNENAAVVEIIEELASIGTQMGQFVQGGRFEAMQKKGFCRRFEPTKSFIRLYSPKRKKIAGGQRVKKITISDEWASMAGGEHETSVYGQVYEYTTEGELNGNPNAKISSGVAAYEPLVGGDVNPFYEPIYRKEWDLLTPGDYQVGPLGEAFFPAPTIIYSKVTIRNLPHPNVPQDSTGKMVYEYFTAKDFPTILDDTRIKKESRKNNPILSFMKMWSIDRTNVTQGFLIHNNDMHGKPKSQMTYNESGVRVSGVSYHYKSNPDGTLNNYARVILPDGEVDNNDNNLIGLDYNMTTAARESSTHMMDFGVDVNIEGFMAGIFPVAVPIPVPSFASESTRFRSIATTKHIQQYGLLEKTVAYDMDSKIETENLAYDAETGEVLLTKTYNEFNDPIYNLKHPTHWAYEGMQGAYQNVGAKFGNLHFSNGIASPGTWTDYFTVGDRISVGQQQEAWVIEVDRTLKKIKAVYRDGTPVSNVTDPVTILESGHRNQQALSIGTVTTMKDPSEDGDVFNIMTNGFNRNDRVLDASATEFSDEWETFCECGIEPNPENGQVNPFMLGMKGAWRPKRSWFYLTDRHHPIGDDPTDIQRDGTYKHFYPFWIRPPSGLLRPNPAPHPKGKWTLASENMLYSPLVGNAELESKNAIGLFSSATFGYGNSLVTSVASNAQYKEIGFEGFEDLNFGCSNSHFRLLENGNPELSDKAHSGRSSLKVKPNDKVQISINLINCEENQ